MKFHNIFTDINSNLKYGMVLDCCGQLNTIKSLKSAQSIQYKIGFYKLHTDKKGLITHDGARIKLHTIGKIKSPRIFLF